MSLPATVTFGTVIGSFFAAVADGSDAGADPDSLALTGLLTFTPSVVDGRLKAMTSTPPATINQQPVPVQLVAGAFSVNLIATDNAAVDPVGWVWTVDFNLHTSGPGETLAATRVTVEPFSFSLPAGTTQDLTLVAPAVPVAGGTYYLNEALAAAAAAAASADSAAASAALVGAPADSAMAAVAGNSASAYRGVTDPLYAATAALAAIAPTGAVRAVGKGELAHNVMDSGAVGDGTTDDSTAIQTAINLGGETYFPPTTNGYLAHGLTAISGMRLRGGSRGYPGQPGRTLLFTNSGDLFTTTGTAWIAFFLIENMELDSVATLGGELLVGKWSQGTLRNVGFRQYNSAKRIINASGWIDCAVTGCDFIHTSTPSVPTFEASSSSGNIAQITFKDTRFTNSYSGQPAILINATAGNISNVRFENINFETCPGGAIKLLSCRLVSIRNCGLWDFSSAATDHLIYIGKTADAPQGITIEKVVRDASTAPGAGIQDIYIDSAASAADIEIIHCQHQTNLAFNVDAGGANGRVVGAGVTLTNGTKMQTDTHVVTWASAAPTTGTHVAGEQVWKTAPTRGTNPGWICTTAGTPGTWSEMEPLRVGTGQVTLAAGTVTVASASVTAGTTQIRVWPVILGGTPGALYVSAKVAGTSFTISSTSAADTSVVQYEILTY